MWVLSLSQLTASENLAVFFGCWLVFSGPWVIMLLGKAVTRVNTFGLKNGGLDNSSMTLFGCGIGQLMLVLGLMVGAIFPGRVAGDSASSGVAFLTALGIGLNLFAAVSLGVFLIRAARAVQVMDMAVHRRLLLVLVLLPIVVAFSCSVAMATVSGAASVVVLVLFCFVAALALGMAATVSSAVCFALQIRKRIVATRGSANNVRALDHAIALAIALLLTAVPILAGVLWFAILLYVGYTSSSAVQFVAAECLWRLGCFAICALIFFSMDRGGRLDTCAEVKAEFVAYLQRDASLTGGVAEVQSTAPQQQNIVCRRVPLVLAEDLPFWSRFAGTGEQRRKCTVANLLLFPNPFDATFMRVHATFTVVEVFLVVLMLLLNLTGRTTRYTPGAIAILAFMLYGFTMRTLSGALIDPQAWLAIFIVKTLRRLGWAKPDLVPSQPRRFAHFISVIVGAINLTLICTDYPNVAIWILFLQFSVAFPMILGYCLGCGAFYILVLVKLVPQSVCEGCNTKYIIEDEPTVVERLDTSVPAIERDFGATETSLA